MLLSAGADLEKAANDGSTPLTVACYQGHMPIVRLLIEHGACIDRPDDEPGRSTPLISAAAQVS